MVVVLNTEDETYTIIRPTRLLRWLLASTAGYTRAINLNVGRFGFHLTNKLKSHRRKYTTATYLTAMADGSVANGSIPHMLKGGRNLNFYIKLPLYFCNLSYPACMNRIPIQWTNFKKNLLRTQSWNLIWLYIPRRPRPTCDFLWHKSDPRLWDKEYRIN